MSRVQTSETRLHADPIFHTKHARDYARAAVLEEADGQREQVGRYLYMHVHAADCVIYGFQAKVPGYRGWQWQAVVAKDAESNNLTISEIVLIPGKTALQAPAWIPYRERIRPGDLGPGDVLPPQPDDPRLTEDDTAAAVTSAARKKLTSLALGATAARWQEGDFGPDSEFAAKAENSCASCGFFVALAQPLGEEFGVCLNEYSADGHVVHVRYGCGAHTDTPPVDPIGKPTAKYFDDASIDYFDLDT
ncbi:MAG: DUF3027 domain-containing protein [Corynebacterium sp.]|nr:DUF3027 domain-containing protein [Corynebacterium sp.]